MAEGFIYFQTIIPNTMANANTSMRKRFLKSYFWVVKL